MSFSDRAHRTLLGLYRRLPVSARRSVVRRVAPGFTVGSICLVERADGRVLLIRHSYRERWGLPGGLAKRGEEIADTARREVREEVSLVIELAGEPTVVVDPEPRRVDVIFRARPAVDADADGARPSSPEIVEVGWFEPTAFPALQHETAQALQAVARAGAAPVARPLGGTG